MANRNLARLDKMHDHPCVIGEAGVGLFMAKTNGYNAYADVWFVTLDTDEALRLHKAMDHFQDIDPGVFVSADTWCQPMAFDSPDDTLWPFLVVNNHLFFPEDYTDYV